MNNEFKRMTPEEALDLVKKEQRGSLKIFIGYAPGVGKTYSMLNEANRLLERGHNVVIGYIETHGRKETEQQIGNLKIMPRNKIEYNNTILYEMDTSSIIDLHPEIVLVDELAHTNVPGSKNLKRYEDVEEILQNGIDVISTLNIQHLESLNDIVKQITGIKVNETIPDRIVENAEEVVVVDLTPDSLRSRLKRGEVYRVENVERSLKNFFRKGNLNALRELALRQTAEEVDEDLEEYMQEHGIKDLWHTVERVMVCINEKHYSKKVIRRGARIARKYKCEWFVVHVDCTNPFAPKLTENEKKIVESHFKLAEQLGAKNIRISGKSVSRELANFATQKHVTQIIISHSKRTKWETFLRGSTINKLMKFTKDIEFHVIPTE